ncbi:putative toxin-antitoxin system toxin component, PIN family [bacterium]|nr:putative toxin-antitoxin system toxin component, PIN family [bacterium]
MKVLIDTNILISAVLFPGGRASAALMRALLPPYQPIVCSYIIDELHHKFQEKFPHKQTELKAFLYSSMNIIHVIETPEEVSDAEKKIRDIKDRPILRAAVNYGVDYLLTGDKDFLEAKIKKPIIISAADFLEL